jgi:hypothetical protein
LGVEVTRVLVIRFIASSSILRDKISLAYALWGRLVVLRLASPPSIRSARSSDIYDSPHQPPASSFAVHAKEAYDLTQHQASVGIDKILSIRSIDNRLSNLIVIDRPHR